MIIDIGESTFRTGSFLLGILSGFRRVDECLDDSFVGAILNEVRHCFLKVVLLGVVEVLGLLNGFL